MVVHDQAVYPAILFEGSVGFGRTYADGLWDCDDLVSLVRILSVGLRPVTAIQDQIGQWWGSATDWARRLRPPRPRHDRDNIQAHYDLSNEFFELMLDETMMYSSAIFTRPGMDLAEAQRTKLDRLCAKLGLGPEDHVLEIGAGWGGFAVHAASTYGCRVTTTTISDAQFRYASKRVAAAGLSDRVDRPRSRLPRPHRHVRQTHLHRDDRGGRLAPARHVLPHLCLPTPLRRADGPAGDHRGRPELRAGQERNRLHPGDDLSRRLPSISRGDHPCATALHTPDRRRPGGHRSPLRRDAASMAREHRPQPGRRSQPWGSTDGSSASGTCTSAIARGPSPSVTSAMCRWCWPCPTGRHP